MYDAIVIGAGPGGATAATCMADAGLRVLLLDKARFPRDKICGDAISGKSVDVLRRLGLAEDLADSQDAWGITFSSPSGASVSIPFTEDYDRPVPPAFVCPRTTFDHLLFERAVASPAEVWQEAAVERLLWEQGQVAGVRIKPGANQDGAAARDCRAPLVVGADGAYSVVVREVGLPQLDARYYAAATRAYYEGVTGFHPRHFMEIHFLEESLPGYFWIFPMGQGRANVGVGMLSRAIKKGRVRLKALLEACVAHPRFRDRFASAQRVGPVKGWGLPLGSRPRPMAGDGWLLLGDAASLIDPFTGEGIGNAMVSGEIAARWARQAKARGAYTRAFLQGYEREVTALLHDELRLSHAVQRLTNWKTFLNVVIRKAGRVPELVEALSCMFDDEQQRRKLLSPLFYLRLLAA